MAKTSEVTYPLIKSVAWRFIRAGVAGGVGTVVAIGITLKPDLSNIQTYGTALLSAFIAGFVSGAGLMARDYFGDKDRSEGAVNKLPI